MRTFNGHAGAGFCATRIDVEHMTKTASAREDPGRGRWCRRAMGYPGVTRRQISAVFLGKIIIRDWFGTEGSEVQILSPRPILINKIGLPSTVIVG